MIRGTVEVAHVAAGVPLDAFREAVCGQWPDDQFHCESLRVDVDGCQLAEMAGIRYHPADPYRSDVDLMAREITVLGKGGRPRMVKLSHEAARRLDRYLRVRSGHRLAWRPELWLGEGSRGPLDRSGIYQLVVRRGQECGVLLYPHRFRHHFCQAWLDRGGAEGDLMELAGWSTPQMIEVYGGSRARRTGTPQLRPRHGRHESLTCAGGASRRLAGARHLAVPGIRPSRGGAGSRSRCAGNGRWRWCAE